MSDTRILLVEDSATDALICKHALRKTFSVTHAPTLDAAHKELRAHPYDLVVSDCFLPDGTVMELLVWISAEGIDAPVVVMSGQGDERTASEVFKLGAYDYLVKSEESLSTLSVAISHALERHGLERRAQTLQAIVENASDCIVTMDVEGRILTANRAVKQALGYSPDELIGQPAATIFAPTEEPTPDKVFTAERAEGGWQGELVAKRKGAPPLPVHMSLSMLRNRSGACVSLIGIARDMSERQACSKN